MKIGLTDIFDSSDKLDFYIDWLGTACKNVEIILLSHKKYNLSELAKCNALVLAGGGDVYPAFYGQKNKIKLLKGVNKERDKFEIKIIHSALKNKIPILGICRGMQIVNVALGGTLIGDLEEAGFKNHRVAQKNRFHKITIEKNTLLSKIIGSGNRIVNSSHHQAIGLMAKHLKVSARSFDCVLEGAEWKNPNGKSPMLLIQWHPERMKTSATSKKIIKLFIKKIKQHVS
jgi:putative glutamine amidotransferase